MLHRRMLQRLTLLLLGLSSGAAGLLRIATWNLLAPQYARPEKYPWCDPKHLDWDYRQSLIVPQLLQWDADVVCLQEVQVEFWPKLISSLGDVYDGIIQNVTRNHNVASAMLLRKECSWTFDRVESRSRALLCVLRHKETSSSQTERLYVANVHLEAGIKMANDLQRYHQVKSLFKRLAYHCDIDSIPLEDAALVLAGDFNVLRSNIMHLCLSQGQLYHPQQAKIKPPIRIAKLQDALGTGTRRLVQMTFARGHVLDYIWTSSNIQAGQTLPLSPHVTQNIPKLWPSRDIPSDHLPIGVELAVQIGQLRC